MAIDLPEVHARALAGTRRFVAGVAASQWDLPSDCEDWTVRELVNHVVSGQLLGRGAGGGQDDRRGRRPARRRRARRRSARGLRRLGGRRRGGVPRTRRDGRAVRGVVRTGAGIRLLRAPVPRRARPRMGHRPSTGQDATLDPELVDGVLGGRRAAARRSCRGSGAFGEALPVPDGADAQTRLLALLGRSA